MEPFQTDCKDVEQFQSIGVMMETYASMCAGEETGINDIILQRFYFCKDLIIF